MTPESIRELSYPDFVGYINQWNVLPGAHVTLSKWIQFGRIDQNSRILQVACTTGFQSREIAHLTKCSGKGFDLSPYAIEMAKYNLEKFSPDARVEYFVADGLAHSETEKYSHVLVGAGLKFFSDPDLALKKSLNFLNEGGYLLASPFYVEGNVPQSLIQQCQKVFGITPTIEGYKRVMAIYSGLEIMYEDRNDIIMETPEEIEYYCHSTIKRTCQIRGINDQAMYDTMFARLKEVKETTNALREFQKYAVLVCRYRKEIYPNRYVELF